MLAKKLGRLVVECGHLEAPHLGFVWYRLRTGGYCFYLDLYGVYAGWTWRKK